MTLLRVGLMVLAMLVTVPTGGLFGQSTWVPYTAKYRKAVYSVAADGGVSLHEEDCGTAYRASNGSRTTKAGLCVNGQPDHLSTGEFVDATTGKVYRIDYASGTAMEISRGSAGPNGVPLSVKHTQWKTTPDVVVGHQNINGLSCLGIKVKGPVLSGASWVSLDNDLVVKTEMDVMTPSGRVRYIMEKYDINLWAEPSAADSGIPATFKVLGPRPQLRPRTACPTCAT